MDLNSINKPKTNINNITSKISIKNIKNGRHKRTYIVGLHYFLTEDEIKNLIIVLKKKLGAGVDEKITDNIKEYGFQGEHERKMKGYIMENSNLQNDAFE